MWKKGKVMRVLFVKWKMVHDTNAVKENSTILHTYICTGTTATAVVTTAAEATKKNIINKFLQSKRSSIHVVYYNLSVAHATWLLYHHHHVAASVRVITLRFYFSHFLSLSTFRAVSFSFIIFRSCPFLS